MGNKAVVAIQARYNLLAHEHWRDCLDAGLDDHSERAHAAVDAALDKYFARLAALAEPVSNDRVLDLIRQLLGELEQVKRLFGDGLLETDERELFVPLIIEAATAAGLDPSRFPNEDPTGVYRTF